MSINKSHVSMFRYIYTLTMFIVFSFTVSSLAQAETSEEY